MNMHVGNAAHEVAKELGRHARRASDSIEGLQHEVLRRGRRGMRRADYLAHEHPWETAGAALILGAALGALTTLFALRR